ncbi:MAG: hypothetical protein RLZZ107_1424, partial [Bacteroidota bacterium]
CSFVHEITNTCLIEDRSLEACSGFLRKFDTCLLYSASILA